MLRFTAKGRIQVWDGSVLISSHVQEREAYERIAGLPPGRYTVTFPVIEVVSSGSYQSVYSTSSESGRVEARGMAVQVVRLLSDTTPPAVPSGFSATASTATTVTLTLTANVESDFSNYVLERSTDNIGWGYLKSFTGVSTTDTVDISGSVYYYRVFALDTRGNRSAYTSVKSAGPYTVNLAWNGTIPNVSFIRGNAQNFDLSPYIIGSSPTITVETGTLPSGVTLNSSLQRLQYDGTSATSTAIVATGISFRLSTSEQSDWQTRISGSGVVWYHSFDSDAEVNQFRFNNDASPFGVDPNDLAKPGTCVRDATGGVDGGGCLKLTYPVGSANGSAWGRPFSPIVGANNGRGVDDPGAGLTPLSWNSSVPSTFTNWNRGWYGNSSYHGQGTFDGTTYYIQFRMKMDSNRYANSTGTMGGSGGKVIYLDHVKGSNQEVIWTQPFGKWWEAYSDFGAISFDGPPGQHAINYGSQWPNCGIIDPPSTYCYIMPSNTWITWHWTVTLGTNNGSNSYFKVEFAEPGETSYTTIYEYSGQNIVYSQTPWGHNAFIASNYFNGATCTTAYSQWYDQIIFSLSPIPCPQV